MAIVCNNPPQGYPLTVCPDAMLVIAKHAAANDKMFMMNLSAPFLCSVFKDAMLQVMPYVDILFGNESVGHVFFVWKYQTYIDKK